MQDTGLFFDAALASWKDNHLQELIAESKTEPQKAIDKAAEHITKALLGAAKSVLQTREIRTRRPAMPQRRYPAYWNADLQMQHRTIKHARQQVRIATEYGDPDEIQQTEQALQLAVAQQAEIERHAIQQANQLRSKATEEDFAHGGTEATNYQGGGGYLKRAWDRLKRELIRSQRTKRALPTDMQNSSGMRATDDAESRRNWRAHGAKLGKWDPLDPKYDRDFAPARCRWRREPVQAPLALLVV